MRLDAGSGSAAAPTCVLIVEDLPAARALLHMVVDAVFPAARVESAATLAAARQAATQRPPELALVDLGLPDGSGVSFIEWLRLRAPACQPVVTTIHAGDEHLFSALRAGAAGYLLKDQAPERLTEQLARIAAGEPPLSPAIARRLLSGFVPAPTAATPPRDGLLAPRERETLTLIAKGYQLGEVAAALGVTRNTAAGYIKGVYRKLEISSRAEAALVAARMGLVGRLH